MKTSELVDKLRRYILENPDLVVETVDELLRVEKDLEKRLMLELIRNCALLVKLRRSKTG